MIGDTLTMENLLAIFNAMAKIKPIDQSECFVNYMEEVIKRLQDKEREREWIEKQLSKAMEPGNQAKEPGKGFRESIKNRT